jgi:hypothetical protein
MERAGFSETGTIKARPAAKISWKPRRRNGVVLVGTGNVFRTLRFDNRILGPIVISLSGGWGTKAVEVGTMKSFG